MVASSASGSVKVEGLDTLVAAMAEQSKAITALLSKTADRR